MSKPKIARCVLCGKIPELTGGRLSHWCAPIAEYVWALTTRQWNNAMRTARRRILKEAKQ